jgi:mono/diheme cytochrome c family protein
MRHGTVLSSALGLVVLAAVAEASGSDPSIVFARRCGSCHTVGGGDKVGPDLRGVAERRERGWLRGFIRSSESVIRSGDPVAGALFRRYRRQRMPDHDLSHAEIDALIDLIAAGGPQPSAAARSAETATPEEIEKGRELFGGRRRLANGGAACVSCHAVADRVLPQGASLAPELTDVYVKYRDQALASFLRQVCFPRVPEATRSTPLTEEEAFAVKAYLRQTSLHNPPGWSSVKSPAVSVRRSPDAGAGAMSR